MPAQAKLIVRGSTREDLIGALREATDRLSSESLVELSEWHESTADDKPHRWVWKLKIYDGWDS